MTSIFLPFPFGVVVAGGAVPVVESTVQIRSAHIEQLCPHRWSAIQ